MSRRTGDGRERFDLGGGAELLVLPQSDTPAAALAALVRLGPDDEGRESGAASLLARLVGTEAEGRGGSQIQRDVDSFGAIGSEYDGLGLTLWAISDPNALESAARTLLVNVLAHPSVAPDAFATARDDLNRQRQRQSEDLLQRTLDGLRSRVLGREISLLGTERSLGQLTPAKVEAFHGRFFRPSRTTLLALGRVNPESVRQLAQAQLGAAGWLELPPAPLLRASAPQPLPSLRDLALPVHAPATAVALGFLWPGFETPGTRESWPALLVLDALLGGGKGARLFALRDRESLGYDVHTVLAPDRLGSLWAAYLVGDIPLERTKAGLRRALEDAAKGNFTGAELSRAVAYLKGQRLRGQIRLLERVRTVANELSMGLPPQTDRLLDTVSLGEVNALARRLLGTNPALVHTGS